MEIAPLALQVVVNDEKMHRKHVAQCSAQSKSSKDGSCYDLSEYLSIHFAVHVAFTLKRHCSVLIHLIKQYLCVVLFKKLQLLPYTEFHMPLRTTAG